MFLIEKSKMNKLQIFTDGSCFKNNRKNVKRTGGIGIFFGQNDPRNVSQKLDYHTITNNTAELIACIKAINIGVKTNKNIIIYSDSNYVINSITKWANKWSKNNWNKSDGSPIKNKELIQELHSLYKKYNIEMKHVRAHKKAPKKDSEKYYFWYGNNQADLLAVNGNKNKIK